MAVSIQINPAVAGIPYGDRKKIVGLTEGKKGLIDLMSGNPYMEMPAFVRERIKERVDSGPMRYTNYWGLPELRERLSVKLKAECRIEADPEEEILITHGVQEALYIIMRTILKPGDEVIIPTPHYANYLLNTVVCGAEPVFVPLYEKNNFVPEISHLERAITPKTRLLIFSNPSNPLGVTWPDETIKGIAELAQAHDLLVVVDEIYREFAVPKPPLSIGSLSGMKERTFTLQGFSKTYFMMGMRIGYLVGPAKTLFHIRQLHYIILLCPSTVAQHAALAALDCPREQVEPVHQEFREKLKLLHEGVIGIPGVSCVPPNGAFYVFPNFKCFGMSSLDLSAKLIEEAGVMTLPGTEFGPEGEGYLRLSVVSRREQVEEGLRRLIKFAEENL
ncbi:putative N-acetyl-LL-diaminopimelate aminotransferase [subsurface metagenome]